MQKKQQKNTELENLMDLDTVEIQNLDDDVLSSIAGGCTTCSCGTCSINWDF